MLLITFNLNFSFTLITDKNTQKNTIKIKNINKILTKL